MKEELKWIENKAIRIHENVMPIQAKGKLIYPKAYFEDDVKELIKKVKDETRRETLKEVQEEFDNVVKQTKETIKKRRYSKNELNIIDYFHAYFEKWLKKEIEKELKS